ncbi:MAG TPA: hypothetical protein VGI10_22105 [Polyangiaceae bacterium]|jgi:uncharacterized membrane protein YgcG
MSALSDTASGLIAALCSFTIVSAAGCGTDAKGIDDCRSIEEARCEAAKNCGIGVTDVDACRRFYRDQCLHGLAVDSPGGPVVASCVAVIRAAGACATSPDTLLSSCPSPLASEPATLTKACQVVTNPELATECAFLAPPPAASGSAGGAGTAGAAGNAGSAGTAGSGGSSGGGGASGAVAE